ncbi:MAG: acyltransferase family protein, partial [Fluviicola sp.]|nr:acyltransferase family protein [Fluviicola sp.]
MNNERNFGLDLIRFIAIILVVIVHSSFFLNQNFINSIYIIDGVDLFFVLSGFLIGKIIINNIIVKNKIEFKDVKSFLIRRWLRTIPNYVLFLIINIVLIYFNLIDGFLNKYL